jgi:hypothetical protein
MLSPTKDTEVEFERFIGTNVDTLQVEMQIVTETDSGEAMFEGTGDEYLSYLVFTAPLPNKQLQVELQVEQIQVDGLVLMVDGEAVNLTFPTPIRHTERYLIPNDLPVTTWFPLLVSFDIANMTNGTAFPRTYKVDKDIVVEDYGFKSFIGITESRVYKDDVFLGSLEDVLPLEVEAGSELLINTQADFLPNQGCTVSDVIYTNTILSYRLQSDPDELLTEEYVLVVADNAVDNTVRVNYLRSTR